MEFHELLPAVTFEVPDQERSKSSCCDALGEPPADAAVAQALADAVSAPGASAPQPPY